MNKELTTKYKIDFAFMRELVNAFDPCGLIEGGAPADEYDGITNGLLSLAYNKGARKKMREFILREIEPYFSTPEEILNESDEARFNNELENLLNRIEQRFR